MAHADRNHKNVEKVVQEKQEKAEKQAAKLQRRASMLRKFAEKYRENSANQLLGWQLKVGDKD